MSSHLGARRRQDVTSRFLNVISLFSGFIPLVAIRIQGMEVNAAFRPWPHAWSIA